jgi:hypothetical protein
MLRTRIVIAALLPCIAAPVLPLTAQAPVRPELRETAAVPPTAALTTATTSPLRDAVDRYVNDRGALLRRHDAPYSAARRERLRGFYTSWQDRLAELDWAGLNLEARIDHTLLRNEIRYQLALLDREAAQFVEMQPLLPFATVIARLQEERRDMQPVDARGGSWPCAATTSIFPAPSSTTSSSPAITCSST